MNEKVNSISLAILHAALHRITETATVPLSSYVCVILRYIHASFYSKAPTLIELTTPLTIPILHFYTSSPCPSSFPCLSIVQPSRQPSQQPTCQPTSRPTPSKAPTVAPSFVPSESPSIPPTISPSFVPTGMIGICNRDSLCLLLVCLFLSLVPCPHVYTMC